ncbi:hypothetical protein BDN71DRAFT_1505810 [Pleurotus eryngii]|uniref:Uncharacterized protein n=1 Tax=Pleurotus eryngii TaxID=5323 RepID=A0A9P5ZZI6_PLEER|nr:hypothetical protein BDN71DRAFT_1505810 [Pleurotus eryngii]
MLVLGRVLRVTLFGAASPDKFTVQMSTLKRIWGVNELMAASLAFAVITAVHVLSSDTSLNEMGLVSLIPYRTYYYKLKSTLVLHADAPPIHKAFCTQSAFVFEGINHDNSTATVAAQAESNQHSVHSLHDALCDIDSSDNNENDNNTSGSADLPQTSRPLTIEYETFDLAQVIDSRSDSEPISPAVVKSTPELQPAHGQPSTNNPSMLQLENSAPVNPLCAGQGKKTASHRGDKGKVAMELWHRLTRQYQCLRPVM